MQNRLASDLENAIREFKTKVLSEVKEGPRFVPGLPGKKPVEVRKTNLKAALRTIFKGDLNDIKEDFLANFDEVRMYLPLCSSPKAFRTAWDLRSEILSPIDAETLASEGGQLIPVNTKSRILQCVQHGVQLGPHQRFLVGVRHSEGNYDDKLDDLGGFTYQPPRDVSGMLRYRFAQYISQVLKIPYIVIVVMWFKYELNKDLKHVFVLAPAKIIKPEESTIDLNISIHAPLELRLMNRDEAYSRANNIFALNETGLEIETRFELPEMLAREWAYDKICNTSKGKQIKKWAQKTGKKCPGDYCGGGEFRDLSLSKITFGHIIPQNWSKSFTYLMSEISHPDNMYLTCAKCNSSLNENFPDRELRNAIVSSGTIGDWLRKNEFDIRDS